MFLEVNVLVHSIRDASEKHQHDRRASKRNEPDGLVFIAPLLTHLLQGNEEYDTAQTNTDSGPFEILRWLDVPVYKKPSGY